MNTEYILIGVAILVGLFIVFGRNSSSIQSMPPNVSDEDIRALALQGRKIQAIKWYRSLHAVDLKAAKTAVDEMILDRQR